jgi:hypothetical protein
MHSSHSRHGSGSYSRPVLGARGVSDGQVLYVQRRKSSREGRPRSGRFLTMPEVVDNYGTVETPRATRFVDLGNRDRDGGDGWGERMVGRDVDRRERSRSITYATTGNRLSRERIVIEEDGRRTERYRTIGSI